VGTGPPAPALAAGYLLQTAGPAVTLGLTVHDFNFFSVKNPPGSNVQNSDGSLTCTGIDGNGYGAGVCTAYHSTVGTPPNSWKGGAYGGGFFIEAVLKFPEVSGVLAPRQWPAFWALAIESLTGGAWNNWARQPIGYGHSLELDVFEYDAFVKGSYGVQVHDWFGAPYQSQQGVSCIHGGPIVTGADLSQYHKYGFRWVPASATGRGSFTSFFDDVPGKSYSYDQYNAALDPPPVLGTSAGSIADMRHFVPILGCSNPLLPMTVKEMSVWQASPANNLYQ
jgi:hypothetical protein